MAEDKKEPKKGGEFRVPPRTWILWIAILGAIPLLVLFKDPREKEAPLSEPEFVALLESNAVDKGTIWIDPQWGASREITGTYTVAENGAAVPRYDEAPVVAHMKGREIDIAVDVGVGRGRATVWTCDLTHGYIDINGSYRS